MSKSISAAHKDQTFTGRKNLKMSINQTERLCIETTNRNYATVYSSKKQRTKHSKDRYWLLNSPYTAVYVDQSTDPYCLCCMQLTFNVISPVECLIPQCYMLPISTLLLVVGKIYVKGFSVALLSPLPAFTTYSLLQESNPLLHVSDLFKNILEYIRVLVAIAHLSIIP